MAQVNRILPNELLRPVFRARALVHVLGLLLGVLLVTAGTAHPATIGFVSVVAIVAVYQVRDCSFGWAFLVDITYAIGIAVLADSIVAPAIVVGWSAVIGLVDTEERWYFRVCSAFAAVLTATVVSFNGETTLTRALAHGLAAGTTAVFFVYAFAVVGRLLRAHDEELRAFFERVPVALTRTSPDGRLLEFNRATAQLFDSPRVGEQVTARYVDPETRRRFLQELSEHGSLHNFEARMNAGQGRVLDAVIAANAVTDDNGKLRFIESAIVDFTTLRRLEVERERLAKVVDSTSDLVAISGRDGTVMYANSAAREWMRRYITDQEYVHLNQPVTDSDERMIAKALASDGSWRGVLTIPSRDGARTISASVQVFEMGGEQSIASISRDVTDEIETERQLKNLLKAKDELVASISHEIRTPLSVVLGLASELRDRYVDFDVAAHQEFAGLIAEQGQEMANIVEDLLVAARADTGNIVLVCEDVVLRDEVEATLRTLPAGEEIKAYVSGDERCWGDANRIRQILRNLISNAQRYGGEEIVIRSRIVGGDVVVSVSDDGPGVVADEVHAIFLPFNRAHAAGTQPASIGLGLSVARDLARRMGGDVRYERQEGHTVFSLTLPVAEPAINELESVDEASSVERHP